jgi:AcrR family transcriptional regulator
VTADLPATAKRGRPRDDSIDERVRDAAAAIFATEGWRGFSFDSVAKAARVGKSTLYLRWPNREELLIEVLRQHDVPYVDVDSGSLRDDLRVLAFTYGRWLEGNQHPVMLRMMIERRTNADFRLRVVSKIEWTSVSAAHRITHRAKLRGDLPPDASSAVILDAVLGGVMQHLTSADEGSFGRFYESAAGQKFVMRLVDYVIAGFVARSPEVATLDGSRAGSRRAAGTTKRAVGG